MKISDGKVVSTSYKLYILSPDDEFDVVEEVNEDDPMYYLAGNSGLPPKYEENLNGLGVNDTYEFELGPEDAYGEFYPENVVDFDIDVFKIDDGKIPEGFLEIGKVLPFNHEDGSKIQGMVKEIGDEKVIIDFNHPLSGKTLRFEGKIISIREATEEEMDHGHVHGPGGHHH